ncbi:glycosyltransferase [Nodosilinea sp. FACHB-131]|uniref:glycosyltransferase family 2 protein n=1 Tax=Cyanophyceae TaxID=3028117 RepID=UPI001686B931|nr:glycosyltransferase family 2 protein [Nodosilinea sp. FACHB-131]MBD1873998.1 glycosyltransferase [Nodosilinea sp. FACHB-131]
MPQMTKALTLVDLPTPAPGKTGWPWTEQSKPEGGRMPDGSEYPGISIVTPSYNQGQFIEETIRSVLLQGYPNLEYIIIDGGSTDNTIDIIRKYEAFLTFWISEKDEGQSHGINKGFHRVTGDLVGWQNSDDFYYPNVFFEAAVKSKFFPDYDVFYGARTYLNLEAQGSFTEDINMSNFDLLKMIPDGNMSNQSMFFRRKVFQEGNFLDQSFNHCMDIEFFWRLIERGYKFKFVPELRGCYRLHENCKGQSDNNSYFSDILKIHERIYLNRNLKRAVRRKAWHLLRAFCLDLYGKSHLSEFRKHCKKLWILSSFDINNSILLDVEIISKYLLSLFGDSFLQQIRYYKSTLVTKRR